MKELHAPQMIVEGDTCVVVSEQGTVSRFPKYQYRPLSSNRTIRVLRARSPLQQATQSQPRVYELLEHALPRTDIPNIDVSNSPYVAVSYCWGASNAHVPLLIMTHGEQSVLPVTMNAWEAIDRTTPALAMGEKTLWIDQVCINQGDKEERAQQVGIMGEIYRRCWHCMIWLGPAEETTDAAYALLHRLHGSLDQYTPIPLVEREVADLSHAKIRARLASKMGTDLLPPSSDPGWVGIARLLEREWFKRIWTFQEAVLCFVGDASFRCGHYNVPFKTFTRASMLLGDQWTTGGIDFADVKFSAGRAQLAEIARFRDFVARGDPLPLLFLLQNNQGRNCHEQNDRIYAFLGLQVEDGPDFSIPINYEQSTRDLFVEVAWKIIQSQRSLRVCAQSPERVPEGGLVGLPSWAPDWTRAPITTAFETLNTEKPYFNAAKNHFHGDFRLDDYNILRTKGKIVDHVQEIIDVDVPNDVSEASRQEVMLQKVIPMLVGTLKSSATQLSDHQIAHLIVKTITLDGYTREMNQGQSDLPPGAWSETTSKSMLDLMLTGKRSVESSIGSVDSANWMVAFVRQALQCVNRRFALLKNNRFGLVPKFTRCEDSIVILHGSSLPFVLRQHDGGCHKMVGSCFVDGLMYGEVDNWVTGDQFNIS